MFAPGFVEMCPENEKRKWGFGFLVAWWCEWGKLLQNGDLVAHLFELVAWGWNLLSESSWSNMRFWNLEASSGCCFSVAVKAGQQIVRSLHHSPYHHSQASRINLSKANLFICFWQSLYIYNPACQGPVTWQEFKYGLGALDNVIKELFVHTIQNVEISQTTGGYKGISKCQQIFCTLSLQAMLQKPLQQ